MGIRTKCPHRSRASGGERTIRYLTAINRLITSRTIIACCATFLLTAAFMPVISEALGYGHAIEAYQPGFIGADFLAFYTGGMLLNKDRASDLYNGMAQKSVQASLGAPDDFLLPFFYPPVYAWLMRPWAMLPYPAAFTLWRLASIVCLFLSLLLICRGLNRRLTWDILLAGAAFPPVYFNVLIGQNAVWLLLVYAMAYNLLTNRRDLLAGLVLGLGLLKPQLFWLILPMAVAQRRWKLLAGLAVTGAMLAASSLAIVGVEGIKSYIAFFTTPFYALPASTLSNRMQSLPQFIRALSGGRGGQFTLAALLSIPILALSWRAVVKDRSPEALFLVSIPGAILGAPQAFHYDLVVLLLPALILCLRARSANDDPVLRLVLAALFWTPLLVWMPFQPSVPLLLVVYSLILLRIRDAHPAHQPGKPA